MSAIGFNYVPRKQFMDYHNRKQRYSVLVCHRRAGKRLHIDTEVPMADGSWTTMGALKDGDIILDADGWPTTVTKAHPVTNQTDAYRVCFDDGSFVIADAEHLWVTQTKLDRAHKNQMRRRGHADPQQRPGTVKTTKEIADTLLYQGESNHTIKLAQPVMTPPADLPIPPYIMGLWLGDGSSLRFELTNMDEEPLRAWGEYAADNGFECVEMPSLSRARTLQLRQGSAAYHPNVLLRNLGLGQAGIKFIPEAYLRGSVDQRMELFRGLMDSDGTIDAQGKMEITFKQREMIDGFHQLACSLGVKLGRPNEKWVQLDGWDAPRRYWRLNFTTEFNPFTIERHRARWEPRHPTRNESGKRFIVACEKIESVPMRCITVDSPDHLYLVTRDYIPTHNTVALLNDMIVRALTPRADGLRQQFAFMAPTQTQARAVAWAYLKESTACFAKCGGFKALEQHLSVTLPDPNDTNKPGSTIMLVGAENAERLRGLYLDGATIDEAADVADYVVTTIIRPALADRQGWLTICGTLKSVDDYLNRTLELASKAPLLYYSMVLKASESGILPMEELRDLKMSMSEEAYEVEMECNVNAAVSGRILLTYLNPAQVTRVPYDPAGAPPVTAWDLGVSDSTAIWVMQMCGREPHILDFYQESGQSLEHFVQWLSKLPYAGKLGAHLLPHDSKVRELGSGKSRIEILRGMGLRNLKVVPKLPKDQQIEAARLLLPKCWFNEDTTADGRKALRNYSFAFDQKRKVFSLAPLHDHSSNAADALQVLAVGMKKAMAVGGVAGVVDDDDPAGFGAQFDDDTPVSQAWEPDAEVF